MADYIGYLVEIDCNDNQTFKGIVSHVDQNNLSLINVYRNNKPYNAPEITLGPKDMKNLRILESPKSEAPPPLPSSSYVEPVASSVKPKPNIKVKHQKPSIKIKEEFKLKQEYDSDNGVSNGNVFYNITEQVPADVMSNLYGASQHGQGNGNHKMFKYEAQFQQQTQHLKKQMGNGKLHFGDHANNKANKKQLTFSAKKRHEVRNDECFNVQIDKDMLDIDFDFEENLKLFDKIGDKKGGSKVKKQLYSQPSTSYDQSMPCYPSGLVPRSVEMQGGGLCQSYESKPDLVSHVNQPLAKPITILQNEKRQKNYRHDENILQGGSLCNNTVQEICLLQQDVIDIDDPGYDYVTDTGLKLPCISVELKKKILAYAEDVGIGVERQNETMSRAATEMALQLIGGAHRLRKDNGHQWPRIVFLAAPHRSGALSIGVARVLASHDINTLVFLTDPSEFYAPLAQELSLYRLSGHPVISDIQDVPTDSIDLIISGLSSYDCESYVRRDVINYINDQKVPVMSLDPNKKGIGHGVQVKYSIISVLPLSYSKCNGKLYLCNLGLPTGVYKELDIEYRSPFGAKFIIPLHQK